MTSTQPTLSIVAPFYRDADAVGPFVAAVSDVLARIGESGELILVDDGSDDGTWEAISAAVDASDQVVGVRLSRNFGKESALRAGLERAVGDAVVTIDGDLQHPPTAIEQMVTAWRGGAEVVDGIKANRDSQSVRHRIASRGFNRLFSTLTGVDLHDASDFKLLDRRALDAWLALPERPLFYRGTTAWIGFDHRKVHFEVGRRASGGSRWRPSTLLRLAINAVTAFSTKPLHLMTVAGLLFVAASGLLLVQTLVRYAQGTAAEGFTTIILLMLLQGGAIMVGLGIIGEYVARIHEEVKQRPPYVLREVRGAERHRGGSR